jgi:hypothetical protein
MKKPKTVKCFVLVDPNGSGIFRYLFDTKKLAISNTKSFPSFKLWKVKKAKLVIEP